MMTLVKIALAACALAAVWAFVPIGDRTLSERWRAAGGVERFAHDGWTDLRGALPQDAAPATPGRKPRPAAPKPAPSAPAQARAARPMRDARPAEAHTDADQRALDRILADRLKP